MKFEMEDIALKQLDPEAYYDLVTRSRSKSSSGKKNINKVMNELKESLEDLNIRYEITGRSKHFYSIYRKMKYQNKQLDEILI
jgi:GTP pyrophosphokinase